LASRKCAPVALDFQKPVTIPGENFVKAATCELGVAQANSSAVLQRNSHATKQRRLSTDQAAEYLCVSPKLLRKAAKDKKLLAYRIGDQIYRFDRQSWMLLSAPSERVRESAAILLRF
jgi:excisionase family DNA binding protein